MPRSCAVPLLFENDDSFYRMSACATGILLQHSGRLFMVTTRHGLIGNGDEYRPAVVVPRCYETNQVAIPLDFFAIDSLDEEDNEIGDFVIVALGTGWDLCACENCPYPYPIDELHHPLEIPVPNNLAIHGFPHFGIEIDYDGRDIRATEFVLSGAYTGPTDRQGVLQLSIETEPPDLNGFSGSPVMLQADQERLLGMIIRGGASAKVAYFLNSAEIKIAISRLLEE